MTTSLAPALDRNKRAALAIKQKIMGTPTGDKDSILNALFLRGFYQWPSCLPNPLDGMSRAAIRADACYDCKRWRAALSALSTAEAAKARSMVMRQSQRRDVENRSSADEPASRVEAAGGAILCATCAAERAWLAAKGISLAEPRLCLVAIVRSAKLFKAIK